MSLPMSAAVVILSIFPFTVIVVVLKKTKQNTAQHNNVLRKLSANEASFSGTISFTFSRVCHLVCLFVFVIVFHRVRCAIF